MYLPSIIRKGLSKYSFMVWATLTILCLWAPLQKSEWFIRETANLEIQYRFGIQTYLTTYNIVPSLNHLVESPLILHRDAFCQFLFRWIYYCYNRKSSGKETGKTHLCAVHKPNIIVNLKMEQNSNSSCKVQVFQENDNLRKPDP